MPKISACGGRIADTTARTVTESTPNKTYADARREPASGAGDSSIGRPFTETGPDLPFER